MHADRGKQQLATRVRFRLKQPSYMTSSIHWLEPHQPFPAVETAWGEDSALPGLLAAGGTLDAEHLRLAYHQGIFPWFSAGQPILWWSPDPRMVLQVADFHLRRSLRKTIQKFSQSSSCEIRIDTAFTQVMGHCASTPRDGQNGTWILPNIVDAYTELHTQGMAHSVETWVNGELVGGLYCVAIGKAVFGESMFSLRADASKIALSALVALCRAHQVPQIDCQQATPHLAFMGAQEIPRSTFLHTVHRAIKEPSFPWQFSDDLWQQLLAASLQGAEP